MPAQHWQDGMKTDKALKADLGDEGQYRLLVHAVIDFGIYMLDPAGTVTSWNRGAQRLKGYEAHEIIGRNFACFYTEGDQAEGKPQAALATAATDGRFENEGWRVRKDGTRFWAHVVVDQIQGDEGTVIGFAKITRDITEKHDAAWALGEANAKLLQSQKMEAVGQLTGGLAHDFNNLLGAISGNLELMRIRAAQGRTASLEHYIETAIASTNRAAALTRRLLAFSRHQTLDPKATDLNRLVQGMVDFFRRTVGPSIWIETDLADEPWITLCDPNQVENALLNLVINARDAMPDGGKLVIQTTNTALPMQADRREAALPENLPAGDYVALLVADTGTGMPPDVLARAFDPFFTTKPMGQGTGLGLSMVYGFAEQSGGHVRIRSEAGHGAAVTMFLPRHFGMAANDKDAGAGALQPSAIGAVVLLVEDEPAMREIILDLLGDLGYRMLEAEDGPSGLAILETPLPIDLLITDVGLPGMNGRQLADAGRRQRPGLKVLFITGYAEHGLVDKGVLEKGTQVIAKPFSVSVLAARVQGMLGD
jgi:PAS domain S-box-containing protein